MNYTPISFKTDYSLLKSLLKVNDIIEFAKEQSFNYVGVLDDNPYGIMDFYDKCSKNNLKCIFGMVIKIGESKIYLYIKNYKGYLNLIQINDLINNNKLSFDELLKYSDSLIAVLPYNSYKIYNRIKEKFDVYLGYNNETELKNALLISKKVLFINEILYLKKSDVELIRILYKIADDTYYDDINYILEASDFDKQTINEFQEKINLKFELNKRYIPVFCNSENESKKYLETLAYKGLAKRLNGKKDAVYIKRLKYELEVIENMGFTDYFLIVYDYVKFARKNDIMANPRGSAAGSLVTYALGITDVDPIKYDLLFERFLNPERVTMPDIDMDFEDTRRGEVIDYVRKKYGKTRVALIIAYATLGSKQVIRDVGKVLGVDSLLIDALSKRIDARVSLKDNLKNQESVEFIKNNNLQDIYKISIRLEGLKKHTTIHAAGVVISSEPLLNIVPTIKSGETTLTGFTMEYLERLGLLKMDFLGLRYYTTIHNIIRLIGRENPSFNLNKIPLDDVHTFEIFKKADTDNIFQFESNGMKNFLRKLSPSRFDDLIAANALFRPGPMQNIDEYIARRHGKKEITYLHPDLEPILKSTYGIIIYQEQIMQILSKMGGYSYAEADLIRRAMSKKKYDVMKEEKSKFISRSVKLGYNANTAEEVYDLIVKFANYGFNKSHSVVYALIGYQMAYLKAHFTNLFSVNNLNMNKSSSKTIKEIIDDARAKGLKIVKPDINKSNYEYVIKNNQIILPLTSIKDISSNISKTIIDNAPYIDIFDLFKKIYGNNINRRVVETLIKAGAMDSLGYSRVTLLENIDSALTYVQLCHDLDESLIEKPEIIESNFEEIKLDEITLFGFYISGHPANKFSNVIKIKDVAKFKNKVVNMGILVEKIKVINTKKGERMAFVDISDDTGSISAVIFPKNNWLLEVIEEGMLYKIKVHIGERNNELQVIINEIVKEN